MAPLGHFPQSAGREAPQRRRTAGALGGWIGRISREHHAPRQADGAATEDAPPLRSIEGRQQPGPGLESSS
jgi:hypothetical protein